VDDAGKRKLLILSGLELDVSAVHAPTELSAVVIRL
jgi:hypothetical protein